MSTDFVVDSCLLIEFFRSKDKSATRFARLIRDGWQMTLSVVVIFEVFAGADAAQQEFWKGFFRGAVRLSFDERVAEIAADIFRKLRQKNIRLESCDVFIAATAIANGLPVATLNHKHFEQIDGVEIL
jgi:predicted nucleic acid-binding protein